MSKFTKGEWVYDDFSAIVKPVSKNSRPICIVIEDSENDYSEEEDANGRLIAAAPKMYERLKLVARLISRQAQGQLRDPIDPAIVDSIYELLASIDDESVETMKYSSSFFQN